MKAVFVALGAVQTLGQSFTSCNTDAAHFQNMALSVSPDPPVLGGMTTIVVEGDLDKSISGGSITVELAAGIIKIPKSTIPFSTNRHGPVTHVKATLGPFKYPNINIPLIKTVKVSVEIKDQDDEQVACVDSSLPALSSPDSALETIPFTSCDDETKSHTKNFHMETNPPEPVKGDKINITAGGDLDEDISSGNIALNVDLSIFKLNMDIPFAISPSVSSSTGAELSVGPLTLIDIPLIGNAKGTVKMTEQNGESFGCVDFNLPVMTSVAV